MSSIQINCNHAGGNIKVISITENRIVLDHDQRDSAKRWFYWSFSAASSISQTIRFEFIKDLVGPSGPAVSQDGTAWRWLNSGSEMTRSSFSYTFQQANEKVFFSFCLPYTMQQFERFYARHSTSSEICRDVLTVSEQLRPLPLLRMGNPNAKQHIVFTARHHACEATASYLVEGLLEYLLLSSSSTILERYLIHYVPFIDLDGVENGDQGKNRIPYDHNRDYQETPIYRSTAALMEYVKPLDTVAFIDFHCPGRWGNRHDFPHFVKNESPVKERIEALSGLLQKFSSERASEQAIRHLSVHDLGVGEEWNKPQAANCSSFFIRKGTPLSCVFEFPYFGKGSVFEVESMKHFGADFARAFEAYLLQ